jgi:catechol 2,3-dioxygenase-like lactoylglutathione lyase family enzyme
MLYVSDIDASVKFYRDAFDLTQTNRISQLTVTKADGSELVREIDIVLLKFPGQDFVYEIIQSPNVSDSLNGGNLFQHVGVDVVDIEAALQQCIAAGGVLVAPIQTATTQDIQVKQAFLQGLDGEMIELKQMVTGEF